MDKVTYVCALFQTKLQYVTLMGAGLLVGTALAVIIPEGVNTIMQSGPKGKPPWNWLLCHRHWIILGTGQVLLGEQ